MNCVWDQVEHVPVVKQGDRRRRRRRKKRRSDDDGGDDDIAVSE